VILLLLGGMVYQERKSAKNASDSRAAVEKAENSKQALEDRVHLELRERVVKAEQTAKDSADNMLRLNSELSAAASTAAAAQAEARSLLRERDELRSERDALRIEIKMLTENLRQMRQ